MCKYGVERKVTHHSTLGATMAFGVPIGVTLTIKVTRGQQTYLFPLHLADEVGITMTGSYLFDYLCRASHKWFVRGHALFSITMAQL